MYSPYKNEYQIWHRSFDRELAARLEAIKLRCLPYADMLEQIKQYSQKLGTLCYSSLIPTSATLFIFEYLESAEEERRYTLNALFSMAVNTSPDMFPSDRLEDQWDTLIDMAASAEPHSQSPLFHILCELQEEYSEYLCGDPIAELIRNKGDRINRALRCILDFPGFTQIQELLDSHADSYMRLAFLEHFLAIGEGILRKFRGNNAAADRCQGKPSDPIEQTC